MTSRNVGISTPILRRSKFKRRARSVITNCWIRYPYKWNGTLLSLSLSLSLPPPCLPSCLPLYVLMGVLCLKVSQLNWQALPNAKECLSHSLCPPTSLMFCCKMRPTTCKKESKTLWGKNKTEGRMKTANHLSLRLLYMHRCTVSIDCRLGSENHL